jgi:hypothetical protein
MPIYRQGIDAQGRPRYVRAPFQPGSYTVPPAWLARLRVDYGTYRTKEVLADPGGPFGGLGKGPTFERDGKRFIRLHQGGTTEWYIEVELNDGDLGEVRAVPPEEAWEIARAVDQTLDPPVEVAPIDRTKL